MHQSFRERRTTGYSKRLNKASASVLKEYIVNHYPGTESIGDTLDEAYKVTVSVSYDEERGISLTI